MTVRKCSDPLAAHWSAILRAAVIRELAAELRRAGKVASAEDVEGLDRVPMKETA